MYGALDMTKDEFEEIEQDVDAGIRAFAKFVEFAVAEKVALYMHPDFDVDNGMVEDEQESIHQMILRHLDKIE